MNTRIDRRLPLLAFVLLLGASAIAQSSKAKAAPKFALKGGANFVNISNAGSINGTNRTGFMAGVFFSPRPQGVFGYRTELIYSRQGHSYKTASGTASLDLDYLLLPQLFTVNITRYFQLQAGGQVGLLLNTGTKNEYSSSSQPVQSPEDVFSKLAYGFAAGFEIYPLRRVLAGARYNLDKSPLNRDDTYTRQPSYLPPDGKQLQSNVLQLYAGFRF